MLGKYSLDIPNPKVFEDPLLHWSSHLYVNIRMVLSKHAFIKLNDDRGLLLPPAGQKKVLKKVIQDGLPAVSIELLRVTIMTIF